MKCPKGYYKHEIRRLDGNGSLVRRAFLYFPVGFEELSEELRGSICNGIGAATGLSRLVPNTIWGLDVALAGDGHDYDYYLGGTRKERRIADRVFYHNLRAFIWVEGGILRIPRKFRAKAYHKALRLGGWAHFNFNGKAIRLQKH